VICDPCRAQQCKNCRNPLGCYCQHRAAATPVRALDGDERHAIALGRDPGDFHPTQRHARASQNGDGRNP
jgi:hypothetical protein